MTKEILSTKSKEEVKNFIRERLAYPAKLGKPDKDGKFRHKRFDMSGYDFNTLTKRKEKSGQCTIYNQSLLNKFADLGIYDYTDFLCLDFHKGSVGLFLKYLGESYDNWGDNTAECMVFELTAESTTEIIYKIFELTIFSDKKQRRRDNH